MKYQETEDSEEVHLNPLLDDLDISSNATEAYRSAMTSIGGSAARASKVTRSGSHKSSADCSALIREEEYVDDWLVDDLQPMKRRKMDVNGLFTTNTTKNRKQVKDNVHNNRTEQKRKQNSKSARCRIEENDSENESDVRSIDKEIHNRDDDDSIDYYSAFSDCDSLDFDPLKGKNFDNDLDNDLAVHLTNDLDNDLDNDLVGFDTIATRQAKTRSRPSFGLSDSNSINNCNNNIEAQPIVILDHPVKPSKPKQTKITSFGTRISAASDASSAVPGLVSSRVGESLVSSVRERLDAPVIPSNEATGSTIGHIAGVVRIKVQIKDKLLLVPVFDR